MKPAWEPLERAAAAIYFSLSEIHAKKSEKAKFSPPLTQIPPSKRQGISMMDPADVAGEAVTDPDRSWNHGELLLPEPVTQGREGWG